MYLIERKRTTTLAETMVWFELAEKLSKTAVSCETNLIFLQTFG